MTTRLIRDEGSLASLSVLLEKRARPFTVTIRSGLPRTDNQNRLQRKWCAEVAEQMADRSSEEVRGEAKLRFGVPIMRRDHDDFAEKYDRLIKPRPYAEKVELMMEPLDFPVTRLMTTKQKTEYLDAMFAHWTAQGCVLTIPQKERR